MEALFLFALLNGSFSGLVTILSSLRILSRAFYPRIPTPHFVCAPPTAVDKHVTGGTDPDSQLHDSFLFDYRLPCSRVVISGTRPRDRRSFIFSSRNGDIQFFFFFFLFQDMGFRAYGEKLLQSLLYYNTEQRDITVTSPKKMLHKQLWIAASSPHQNNGVFFPSGSTLFEKVNVESVAWMSQR